MSIELEPLRSLREHFSSGQPGLPAFVDDQRTDTTLEDFGSSRLVSCRCLVCQCDAARTITYPVVCSQCARGSHLQPSGGVL